MLQELKEDHSTTSNSDLWRKLWNLKISPKVKHFLWRACTNCLPTKDMLQSKRVHLNNICPICNVLSESVLHTLVFCSYATACWSRVHQEPLVGEYSSFQEWLQLVFAQQNIDRASITAMVCWMIRKQGNEVVRNQRSLEVIKVVESAYSVLNQ